MLWRALKYVERGFYIDVGAWSPDQDSVTRAFYERGWCGINIEPNPVFNRKLQECRPRDVNLCLAIGNKEGILSMNFLGDSGLSTLDDSIAHKHLQKGWSLERQPVQVKTLSEIWQKHVPTNQAVHFLKVDVEGFEEAVLKGNDWSENRPWVVVVEATLPSSQVESHEIWEPILQEANYIHAYSDGLNRFYVAKEHADLLQDFKYPPNVFDGFVQNHQLIAEARATQAEAREVEARDQAQQALALLEQAQGLAQQVEARFNQAEERARQAEIRATQAEARETEARDQAKHSLSLLQQAQSQGQAHLLATQAEQRAEKLQADLVELRTQLVQAEKKLHEIHQANHQHWQLSNDQQEQISALKSSLSWRITAPLRWLGKYPMSINTSILITRSKSLLQGVARYAYRQPRIRHVAFQVLNRYPRIKKRLESVVMPSMVQSTLFKSQPTYTDFGSGLGQLTPRARQICANLKAAVAQQHQEQA